MKILVIGHGGREAAITQALRASPTKSELAVIAGHQASAEIADHVYDCALTDFSAIVRKAQADKIDFAIIGPEQFLCGGLSDKLIAAGIAVVGPEQQGAKLEGSKNWLKQFLARHNIPCANSASFDNFTAAKQYLEQHEFPVVIKADGLAAGKGVTIASDYAAARAAVAECLIDHKFGEAGKTVVIEDFLSGSELSYFVLYDGTSSKYFGCARDHKRLGDNDQGPNTGGMGCYWQHDMIDQATHEHIWHTIVTPLINGLQLEAINYRGIIFFGLMLTASGAKLLEVNCRFGDPECQTLLHNFRGDFVKLMSQLAHGQLQHSDSIAWHAAAVVSVVLARRGYPAKLDLPASELSNLEQQITQLPEHCGIWLGNCRRNRSGSWSAGTGRVITVAARAANLTAARSEAYKLIDQLAWEAGYFRRDIAAKAADKSSIITCKAN